jgi:glycosyltransferase involved in cell wall biosynthesis
MRAFARMPSEEPHLVLVGDGPERGGLEALARDLGVEERVHFTGRLERPEQILGISMSSPCPRTPSRCRSA